MDADLPLADDTRSPKTAGPLRSIGVVLGLAAALIVPVLVIGNLPGTTIQSRGVMGVLWSVYSLALLGVLLRRLHSWPIVVVTAGVAACIVALGAGALGQALGGVDEVSRWFGVAMGALVSGIVVVLALAIWPRRA